MRLTDDQLREVLARAEEIQRTSWVGTDMNAELQAVIGAAEEVGLARPAVERALRERFDIFATAPTAGSLVFAKSADGKFYVAEVVAVTADGVRVRFLRGSEHVVGPDEVRPCSLIPGEKVVCNWPWWGEYTCTVLAYDAEKKRVKLSDGWGTTKTFSAAEVWLEPPRKVDSNDVRSRVYATLIGVGLAVGAIGGSIVTALLLR
jgi:hypothetical protein